ncbi:hypothetical protein [Nonomuraea sp. NPDC049695]|uniref:hypothetical protein n=1 Tax=Nonomuraea sp. NPDC049695 TaxID=3154734 RepID=UPI0034418962
MVHIRPARHGDGHAAETLAATALGDATGAGPRLARSPRRSTSSAVRSRCPTAKAWSSSLARGGRLVYVEVRQDDGPRLRWYRRRGYHLVPSGEPVILAVAGTTVAFADGGDGFRVMIKVI